MLPAASIFARFPVALLVPADPPVVQSEAATPTPAA
jgi:hypothetical protein